VDDIRLGLINRSFPTGPLDQDVMQAVIANPAYWAFCWGSGLALAQFVLSEPCWVRGKRIVDLGSGSGIAGIAAAKAGAEHVLACDTDADARLATRTNACLNDVEVEVTAALPASKLPASQPAGSELRDSELQDSELQEKCDVLLMADVLYDKANLPLLAVAQRHAQEVLVADSRVTELPDPGYREIATAQTLTFPNLGEFDEFGTAHIFHWNRSSK
jgi:predicted nicotinamide N-methyase